MATEMVLAYGDSGMEPTPRNQVVEIECVPLGPDNLVGPAMVRWLAKRGGHMPTRVRRVLKPNTRLNRMSHAYVEFDCTPFVLYTSDDGPVYGNWSGCYVRNPDEARDSVFDALPMNDKVRILTAVGS